MWYNVIPLFVPLDISLYPTYQIGTKGLDSLIFRNYIGYVLGNVYQVPKQFVVPSPYILYFVGNLISYNGSTND
jgi:hypothetical protein